MFIKKVNIKPHKHVTNNAFVKLLQVFLKLFYLHLNLRCSRCSHDHHRGDSCCKAMFHITGRLRFGK